MNTTFHPLQYQAYRNSVDENPDHTKVFIFGLILFLLPVCFLLLTMYKLRQHDKKRDKLLFNFATANKSKWEEDSFIGMSP